MNDTPEKILKDLLAKYEGINVEWDLMLILERARQLLEPQ